MKSVFVILLSSFCLSISAQLSISGELIDSKTSEPVSYVNIGVVGEGVGTVSNTNGKFDLTVPEKHYSDPIRISIIGYESIEMPVNELEKILRKDKVVKLEPSATLIEEVVISSSKLKSKVVGNKSYSDNISAAFGSDTLGNEMGIAIKIKKRPTIIKDFSFPIGTNENGKIKFRLNIYDMKNGRPTENILKHNIIIETEIKEGLVTTDLTDYHIVVQDDFLISLEWIEDYDYDELTFSASFFSKPVWARSTSQDRWVKIPIIGIGLKATILY